MMWKRSARSVTWLPQCVRIVSDCVYKYVHNVRREIGRSIGNLQYRHKKCCLPKNKSADKDYYIVIW